jgi:hypothetical protein
LDLVLHVLNNALIRISTTLQLVQQKCDKLLLSLLGSLHGKYTPIHHLTRSEKFVEASILILQIDKLIVLP